MTSTYIVCLTSTQRGSGAAGSIALGFCVVGRGGDVDKEAYLAGQFRRRGGKKKLVLVARRRYDGSLDAVD